MACLACGHNDEKVFYPSLKICPICRFVWADLHLSAEQWKEIYNKDYFFGEEYVDYLSEEKALRRNFKRNLRSMSRYCNGGRLLEVGCAYGFFLHEASASYDVIGVDVHEDGCRYAREEFKLDARKDDFLTMSIDNNSIDVVTMWDMLEHVPNPQEFLARSAQVLKKGGHLFLSTLDISSVLARLQGRSWRQIHPPSHVSYFSKKSLRIMVERAGFDMINIKYSGEYRSWNNTWFTLLVLRSKNELIYQFLKKLGWTQGEYYLNTFDHVRLTLRKR